HRSVPHSTLFPYTTLFRSDSMVRRAIALGLDAIEAIRLASYNTAQYFRLYNRGAIAPGFVADLVVLDDVYTFQVESVYKDGALRSEEHTSELQSPDHLVCR